MKTNKIMFVGAAFLMMISCDTNSRALKNHKYIENRSYVDISEPSYVNITKPAVSFFH